jgi:hypothetical protein
MFNLEIINEGYQTSTDLGLHQVVSKPIEKLQYSKYIDDRSIALDYFESAEINSEDHLELNDLSWRIIENNPNFYNATVATKTNSMVLSSAYRDLIITNTIGKANKDGIKQPLWHKHYRKGIKEANVHYLNNGDSIDVDEGFLLKGGFAYTNYKSAYANKSSDYRVYFISGVLEDGASFNELLNLVPAISKITWEDIDLNTGEVIADGYELQVVTPGQYDYHMNMYNLNCDDNHTSKEWFYKGSLNNLIVLKKPDAYDMSNPWFLRVSNGSFHANGKHYWVPEYNQQPFDGQSGAIRLFNKECRFVTESTIKTPVDKLLVNPQELIHLSVHIFDEEENILAAYTTNPELLNKKYSNTEILYEDQISSWDEYYGFVELGKSIAATNIIKADFYYKADSLILNHPENGLDVNFYNNEELVYNKVLFYLIPNRTAEMRSVYYFTIDEEDRILHSSNKDFQAFETNGLYNSETLIGSDIRDFRSSYCAGYGNENDYLELGEVTFKENYYLDEALRIDMRTTGYLNQNHIEDYFNVQHKGLQSPLGYGEDGQVVQKNNLIYVKYPIDLLDSYGGPYKEETLERYTRRKMRPGMDLVIEYDHPKSTINAIVAAGSITIDMTWDGPGTYTLLFASHEQAEPTILHEIVTSEQEVLSYVDNNIVAGNTYWYWVRIDEYPISDSYGVVAR